jgi:hypothetical protein
VDDNGQSTAAYIHPYNNEESSSQRYKAAEPPSLSMHDLPPRCGGTDPAFALFDAESRMKAQR